MSAAGLAADTLTAKLTGQNAAGIVKSVLNSLEKSVVHLTWERNPKAYKEMVLTRVDVNITTGMVLGAVLLGLLWEIANWFAKSNASANGGDAEIVPDLESLLSLNPTLWLVTDIFGNPVVDSSGKQKTVQVPSTFGAAYNLMLRNFTTAGPGVAAQALVNLVAQASTIGQGGGGSTTPVNRAPGEPTTPLVPHHRT